MRGQHVGVLQVHGDVGGVEPALGAGVGPAFIDSKGVRVLIEADRSCARSGSRLAVLAGDGPVRRLLGLCKLDGRLALVTEHPSPAAQPDAGAMTTRPMLKGLDVWWGRR